MAHIIYFGRIVFLSVLLMEIIILLFRFSSCNYKREFYMFLLIIIFLAIKTFFSYLFFIGIGASLILIYVTGNFILSISPGKFNTIWTISVCFISLVIIVLMILKLTNSIYFSLFYLYITIILFLYPLHRLWHLYKIIHSISILYLLITSILFIFARAFDLVSMVLNIVFIDMTLLVSICLISGLGYIIFQKGYLAHEGFIGLKRKHKTRDSFIHSVFSRIIQTEDTLLLQDRLITSGLLSAGTSHEFKNILTNIKVLSQYGLAQKTQKKKNAVLKEVLENTRHGIEIITQFFDILALKVEEKPKIINVKNNFAQLFKIIRINFRKAGISFHMDIDNNILIYAGRGELEQILINLIRNAIDSVKKSDGNDKKIEIKGRMVNNHAVIEIIDNGGGVRLDNKIFEPHFSLKESSGLGLYLVKMLVNKNNGNIEYVPGEHGACFRIIFPVYTTG